MLCGHARVRSAALVGSLLALLSIARVTGLGSRGVTMRGFAGETAAAAGESSSRRVVAYFPIWLRNGGYTENDIDFSTVSTVAHFAVRPRADGTVEIPDWGPFPDPALVARAHAAGASIVLVVGGDDAAARDGFAGMASSPVTRQTFIRAITQLVTDDAYDGVDLDWEFPANADDRGDLDALVAELRAGLSPGKTLSISVPASDDWGRWFDVPALVPDLDWLGAMTYALSGAGWSSRAFHNAALYATFAGEPSVDGAAAYYLGRGVPPEKLLIGLPFYGERFDSVSALNEPLTSNDGTAVFYLDVLRLAASGWAEHRDEAAGVPFLLRNGGSGVVSYDDAISIQAKCGYVATHGLGGVIVWHLGQDGEGTDQPLLRAVSACR